MLFLSLDTTLSMRFLQFALILLAATLIWSCDTSGSDHKTTKMLYRAINKTDTAVFNVSVTDGQFKGLYEISYGGEYRDSGEVSGYVKGDTLAGNYLYQRVGIEQLHRIPIALLKKGDKLIMGVGSMEIYLERTYFKPGVPIDYEHVKFIFEKQ